MSPQVYLKKLLASFERDTQIVEFVRNSGSEVPRFESTNTTKDKGWWNLCQTVASRTVEDLVGERMQYTQQEYQDIATSLAEIELAKVVV